MMKNEADRNVDKKETKPCTRMAVEFWCRVPRLVAEDRS